MENNYKPNSHKFKEAQLQAATQQEEKKIEKVIDGTARVRKKSGIRKAMDNFISDDVPNIRTYVIKDVIVPTIKKIISETVDMVLFGKSRKSNTIAGRVSYNRFFEEPRRQAASSVQTAHGYNYNEVIVESRGEAELVLSQMNDIIETYDMASVADLYDLVGITGEYTDNRYGWTNVSNAEIVRLRDGGYLIQMPKALPIKR